MFVLWHEEEERVMRKEISAGGVVFRSIGGRLEIQLILDRYGKISMAKGKMEPGETVEQTALREIEEETGIIGSIISPVDIIKYTYNHPIHWPGSKRSSLLPGGGGRRIASASGGGDQRCGLV